MLAISMGQLVNGLSPFFLPLEAEFGWSKGDIGSLGLWLSYNKGDHSL
jgi:hypothetical protein